LTKTNFNKCNKRNSFKKYLTETRPTLLNQTAKIKKVLLLLQHTALTSTCI